MVTLGDQPLITPQAIAAIVDQAPTHASPAVRATYQGRPGHPVLIKRAPVRAGSGSFAATPGARPARHERRRRSSSAGTWPSGHDVDTPADLRAIARRLAGRRR